jgi:hypothetical protein
MRIWQKSAIATFSLGFAVLTAGSAAQCQTPVRVSVALKSGETAELGPLYWISHCRSILKSPPEAEILDGPPGVTVSVKEAMVLPRQSGCANRVAGGLLIISAKDIEDPSYSTVTIRITYKTKDGDRKRSEVFNLSLLP